MRGRRTTAIRLAAAALTVTTGLVAGGAASPVAASVPTNGSRGPAWAFDGRPCRLVPTASPVALDGSEACGGVRPGSPVLTPVGQCTLNFLWRGSDGDAYIGTAGHCLLEGTDRTEAVYGPGDGPQARDAAGHPIGEFAYAALDSVGDFALIRLYPDVQASPEICRFGGPTGMDAGALPPLTPLHHVGRGSLTGSLVPARTQLVVDGSDIRMVTGLGVASAGDSGSPVLSLDGRAVGVVVATGPALPLAPTGLFVFSVRIAPEMGRASAAMGVAFDLVTAPLGQGVLQP